MDLEKIPRSSSYLFIPSSPQHLPVHERLYLDSQYRLRLHEMTAKSQNSFSQVKLLKNELKIEDELIKKGKLSIIQKQKLKEKFESEKMQQLQNKPKISNKSKTIIQEKRLNSGRPSSRASGFFDTSECSTPIEPYNFEEVDEYIQIREKSPQSNIYKILKKQRDFIEEPKPKQIKKSPKLLQKGHSGRTIIQGGPNNHEELEEPSIQNYISKSSVSLAKSQVYQELFNRRLFAPK